MKPLADIIRDASALSGLDPLGRTRKSAVVHVRAAIALAAEKTGYRHGEIGKALRLDRTTVIHLLSMSGRPAVQSLLHKLDPPSAIELDTTFDGDAITMITLDYQLGHFKGALCSSSHESGSITPSGITPAAPAGAEVPTKPSASPPARRPGGARVITKTIRSSRSTTHKRGAYRPICKSNSRFMNGEELRSYALGELGMSEQEFREARARTRVCPTYPHRHQTGAR